MAGDISKSLIIGVSTRALFDLTFENEIFETRGVGEYRDYQIKHENDVLKPGPGFALIESLLNLNKMQGCENLIEVIVMSRNSPDTSMRIFNSIRYYGLDIKRSVLVSGASLAPYLDAFKTDLFLSAHEDDVQAAIDSGIAAGIICTQARNIVSNNVISIDRNSNSGTNSSINSSTNSNNNSNSNSNITSNYKSTEGCEGYNYYTDDKSTGSLKDTIRIAFDGDAVLFTDESERIFKEKGLFAFEENERINAMSPLEEGPFAKFLKKLSIIQQMFEYEKCPIRIALVTSRSAPAHERVIRTLRAWNVRMDEAFFLGGIDKKEILKAFGAQIFFDDQSIHTQSAAEAVPAARVPYKKRDIKAVI